MADRYRRDHEYRNYGYDENYGSIEQREDMGESAFRRGRPNEGRFQGSARFGSERNDDARREGRYEPRQGSEDREQRWMSPRYGQRFGSPGRVEPRYGSDHDERHDYGWQGSREDWASRRGEEWNPSVRGGGQYDEGMGTFREPWRGSGSSYGERARSSSGTVSGQGSGWGAGRQEENRDQGMGTWGREGSSRQYGWSNDWTAGARPGGFSGRGPKGYTRSDERIREDVCDRLSDDDDLDAGDISVAVLNGEVTLEGEVSDRRSKHRAEDIADSVSGVRDVHNRLRAKKSFFQEVGDRLMGRDEAEQHGHHGSGTRNAPATSSTSTSNTTVKNGVTEPNRSL